MERCLPDRRAGNNGIVLSLMRAASPEFTTISAIIYEHVWLSAYFINILF
ncbi:MAG: hypothetical protein J7K53_12190 [Bacteroidales bacterium]|nr:hypothetical protein [Bacteroidales bacterium]